MLPQQLFPHPNIKTQAVIYCSKRSRHVKKQLGTSQNITEAILITRNMVN